MPPTDPRRPAPGGDFDDAWWEELSDYLEAPPRRPPVPVDEVEVEAAVDEVEIEVDTGVEEMEPHTMESEVDGDSDFAGSGAAIVEPGVDVETDPAMAEPVVDVDTDPEVVDSETDMAESGIDVVTDPEMAESAADPEMAESAADPEMAESAADPEMAESAADPEMAESAADAPSSTVESAADAETAPDMVEPETDTEPAAPEADIEIDVDDDDWWGGLWEATGGDADVEAPASIADAADEAGPATESGLEDAPGPSGSAAEPEGEGGNAPAAEAPADALTVLDEEWPRFEPVVPPGELPSRRMRRMVSATTQRRIAAAVLVAVLVAVITLVAPVRNAVASAARAVSDGTATAWDAASDRWRSWSTELQTIAAGLPARQIDAQRQLEGSESLLFVIEDADRRTVGVALLALSPDGTSTVALLPASLYEILPGYGDFSLAEATVFEGPELTAVTVSNVLGIRIDDTVILGPGDLAAVLGGAIDVDLPAALIVDEGGGTERVLAQAGPGERSAELAEALMVVRGTSDQLGWLQRQTAVWDGILAAIGSDPGVPTRLAAFASDPSAATGTLARAAAGDPVVTVVPVTRVALAGAEEGFKVSYDDADEFVTRRMLHLLLRPGERPRVEVLNGNGRILTTRTVAAALIRKGFRVVKTDNAENFDFETTLVIAQGRDHRADADEVLGVLGTGELLLELRAPSGVVDVSIIVGHDIPAGEE